MVVCVADSTFDVVGNEFDDGVGYGSLMQFMDEIVYVHGVDGLAEVKGDDYGSLGWLVLIESLCNLVVYFVQSSDGRVVCFESVLVFEVWYV